MVPVNITLDRNGTLRDQLLRALRDSIRDGLCPPGRRLPGTRTLAGSLGISRNIVLLVFDQLVAEGYLQTRPGSGTRVSEQLPEHRLQATADPRPPVEPPPAIRLSEGGLQINAAAGAARRLAATRRGSRLEYDFQYGVVMPDDRSRRELARLMARSVRPASYGYGDPLGAAPLRLALADHLREFRGLQVDWRRIAITAGSQQALDLVARMLIEPGDRVYMEEPGYQGARRCFEAAGAMVTPARVDAEGVDPAGLQAARLVYVTPSHQFPTGCVLPAGRRVALRAWSNRHGAVIFEDDYDSEYRYDVRPLQPLAAMGDEVPVIHCGTFAKSLFPGLRLGYLVLPESLVEPFGNARWLSDRGCPSVTQDALAGFMAGGHYARHLRRCARRYAEQRQALSESLATRFGSAIRVGGSEAGIHLVTWLPSLSAAQEPQLVTGAAMAGCGVYPIAGYYMKPALRDCPGLLLGYAAMTPQAIRDGVAALEAAWAPLLDTDPG